MIFHKSLCCSVQVHICPRPLWMLPPPPPSSRVITVLSASANNLIKVIFIVTATVVPIAVILCSVSHYCFMSRFWQHRHHHGNRGSGTERSPLQSSHTEVGGFVILLFPCYQQRACVHMRVCVHACACVFIRCSCCKEVIAINEDLLIHWVLGGQMAPNLCSEKLFQILKDNG